MIMDHPRFPLKIATGPPGHWRSSWIPSEISYELTKKCAGHGLDLPIAADEPELIEAAPKLEQFGGEVETFEVDLSAADGVDRLPSAGTGRTVDAKHRPWPRQRVRRLRYARARSARLESVERKVVL